MDVEWSGHGLFLRYIQYVGLKRITETMSEDSGSPGKVSNLRSKIRYTTAKHYCCYTEVIPPPTWLQQEHDDPWYFHLGPPPVTFGTESLNLERDWGETLEISSVRMSVTIVLYIPRKAWKSGGFLAFRCSFKANCFFSYRSGYLRWVI
jgi:hypothetical protein